VDNHKATAANGPSPPDQTSPDFLHLIETDCGPKTDLAALVSHLRLRRGTLEGHEATSPDQPFAGLNAYKHRLQAVRCEYAGARLRVDELEEQVKLLEARLAEAHVAIRSLEERLAESGRETNFYRHALNQMEGSRAWRILQSWRRWRRILGRSG
jgi:hypothetical protein